MMQGSGALVVPGIHSRSGTQQNGDCIHAT
jgi:hypothetical protein